MRNLDDCKGCPLYPNICIIKYGDESIKCPCASCLVKVTCIAQVQSCDEYNNLLRVIRQKLNIKQKVI